ncbi:MAG: hypothetical protein J6036_00900 [Clostridia bacterium]|nr:hypothetical protein [Clostridia bacterium]
MKTTAKFKSINKKLLFVFAGCTVSQIVTAYFAYNFAPGYENMAFFPLLYFVIYLFLFNYKMSETKYPVVSLFYVIMQFIRFVLLPPAIAIAGLNCGVSYLHPTEDSLRISVALMFYEFIVTAFFVYIFSRRNAPERKTNIFADKDYYFWNSGNHISYFIFIIFSIVFFIFFGSRDYINFFVMSANAEARVAAAEVGVLQNVAHQCLLIAVITLFIMTLSFLKKKYDFAKRRKYVFLALIVSAFNIGLIIGESRAIILYSALCSILLMIAAFPEHRKTILSYIFVLAGVIIFLMTIYKTFYAFKYTSYMDAINRGTVDSGSISSTLQIYFMGPEQTALSLDFSKLGGLSPMQPVFDFIRSTPPFSFFVKDSVSTTSVMFNEWIYGGTQQSGYIIPSVGYGYIFFGVMFSPLVAILNIAISFLFEKSAQKAKTAEFFYLFYYCAIRFSFFMFQNTPGIWVKVVIMLISGGLLYSIKTRNREEILLEYEMRENE